MQLISIKAKNYRTLEDIDIAFSKKYCTISGKNNAGKSGIIRLLTALFQKGNRYPWSDDEYDFDYEADRTQWLPHKEEITIKYVIKISRSDDFALLTFIEKIAETKINTENVDVEISYNLKTNEKLKITVTIGGDLIDEKAAKDIDAKIKGSNLLFLYNSTIKQDEYYFGRRGRRLFYDYVLSTDEKNDLDHAGKKLEAKLRRLAREHKEGLNNILGRLSEKYDVEFSLPEGYATRRMPLGINLKDKHVEVPLDDWGSGTQNKTHILMAILQANRIKTTGSENDRITPIVVIEEPESFLHPSAQSEFGNVLYDLASDLGIQVIVTTHSPYLLNRDEPESNILLHREVKRKKAFKTIQVDTKGENWMAPFAGHLGIGSKEFSSLRPLFSNFRSKVLLVEGPIDYEYFNFFQSERLNIEKLDPDIEIVPYGGKDTLKNTLLVKFVLSRFDNFYLTYDLDAHDECKIALERLGLEENKNFIFLGCNESGKKNIEGLLPERILSLVHGKETALVSKLASSESGDRKNARDELKKKYLTEFKRHVDYSKEELSEFEKVIKIINKELKTK